MKEKNSIKKLGRKNKIKILRLLFLLLIWLLYLAFHGGVKRVVEVKTEVADTPVTMSTELESEEKTNNNSNVNVNTNVNTNTNAETTFYSVTKVIDGDTLKVEIDGRTETLRLIGIDTPEVVDPRKPVQCFGREASAKAKELLEGQKIRLETDLTQGERDKYRRLLRYVFLENGTFFNQKMIEEGFAHEYTYQSKPYKYREIFLEVEQKARVEKRGLWADDTCAGKA